MGLFRQPNGVQNQWEIDQNSYRKPDFGYSFQDFPTEILLNSRFLDGQIAFNYECDIELPTNAIILLGGAMPNPAYEGAI